MKSNQFIIEEISLFDFDKTVEKLDITNRIQESIARNKIEDTRNRKNADETFQAAKEVSKVNTRRRKPKKKSVL